MRFLSKPIIFSLLCSFALYVDANAEPLVPGKNKIVAAAEPTQEAPAVVEADRLSGKKGNRIEAAGNVILRKGDQSIRADQLSYSQNTQDVDARGSVVFEQAGSTMSGPHLIFNMDTGIGVMEQPQFYIKENDARGSAEVMHIQGMRHYDLDKATYTTCMAGNDDWLLKMSSLEIDRDRQIGISRHTWVEFMGVPILYSPWMDFPLSDQRKSGFLAPIFGGTVEGGSELTLPYYWNIGTNYDATIAPRFMLKRGLMLNNEFRYIQPSYGGEINVDVLPNDKLLQISRDRYSWKHNQGLSENLNGYINFNRVSDDAYFRDLANTVTATSQVNLLREGALGYNAGWWTAAARVQNFQTLQDPAAPIIAPYARLPQVTLNAQKDQFGANLAFAGEFVEFGHATLQSGQRTVLNPSISYPLLNAPAFYIKPKVGIHGTYYAMDTNATGQAQDVSRTLPLFSLDSGIALERESNMFGGDYLQTLEPRIFYVYVPYRDQAQLPNFDSAITDFNFTQIFTENRFSGSDRIGDANQVTLAATSRLLDQHTGAERLRVMMGERFSFTAPRVNLATPAVSTNKSDILLAASGQVTRTVALYSEYQFDPNQSHTQRFTIASHYRPELGKSLNLGYRFTRNSLRQVDLSSQWPLFGRFHAVARWNYSLQDSRILDAIGGLEYNQDCWVVRFVAQQYATATLQSNTSFFVQLELNGLVKMGSDPLSLLKQNVQGYTKLNDKSGN
jgi:LPS-assembly protein